MPFQSVPPDWLTCSGKPDWSTNEPLTSQPPMIAIDHAVHVPSEMTAAAHG